MGDVVEGYRALEKMRRDDGCKRADKAEKMFSVAFHAAKAHGLFLKDNGNGHYTLMKRNGDRQWMLHLYPSNQRIYHPRPSGKWQRSPHLVLSRDAEEWTLLDVVHAAAKAVGNVFIGQ